MPKTRKNIRVRDQEAKSDPKGGRRRHRHIRRERNVGDPGDKPDRSIPPGRLIP
jgi:hypothetical protein